MKASLASRSSIERNAFRSVFLFVVLSLCCVTGCSDGKNDLEAMRSSLMAILPEWKGFTQRLGEEYQVLSSSIFSVDTLQVSETRSGRASVYIESEIAEARLAVEFLHQSNAWRVMEIKAFVTPHNGAKSEELLWRARR
ncbi:MAG: hypothetical protein AAF916_11385 [Planctomycetota bacterium]